MVFGVFIFGLLIGSFLSVCIYRIPLGREPAELEGSMPASNKTEPQPETEPKSEITISNPPRSFCPKCKQQLRWWHNIPVVSWVLLRGKCSFCSNPISFRYPLVELLTGGFAALSYYYFGATPTALVIFIFCATLIVISFIDYDYYIIPNVISLPGLVIAIGLAAINQFFHVFQAPIVEDLTDSFLGILAGGGFLFFVSEVYLRLRRKEGLGMGDVKLLAMTGALLGVSGSLYTIFVGSLFGSVLGVLLIIVSGKKFSQQLPFGPYLAVGTLLYIFVGPELLLRLFDLFSGRN